MADILPELTAMKSKQHTRPLSRRLPLKPMLLLLPAALLFALFQLAPMLWVIINSFVYEDARSFGNFTEIFSSPFIFSPLKTPCGFPGIGGRRADPRRTVCRLLTARPPRPRRWLIAFTNMTGNFSGVPLAFAFIIILGVNGAITLQLKRGVIEDFNLYSAAG